MEAYQKRVHWHLIQAWVEGKQAYEAQHGGQSAPMSAEEEKAVAPLLRLLASARAPAPELGTENWTSKLQEHLQKLARPIPTYDEEQDPEQIPGTSLQFRAFVRAVGIMGRVPGPQYGLDHNGQCPLFPSKKLARAYAAKCAYEYLLNSKARPGAKEAQESVGIDKGISSTGIYPPVKQAIPSQRSAEAPPAYQPSPLTSAARRSTEDQNSGPASRGSSTRNGQQDTFVAKLARLCQDQGVESPEYDIHVQPDGYFSGHAVFKSSTITLPEGLGHVRDSLGKKETKERIAEAVYGHLIEIHHAHLERVAKFMTDLGPPTKYS